MDLEKLREYCLSDKHPEGRFKARVFKAVLGLVGKDAEELRQALLKAASEIDPTPGASDRFGDRYVIDFWMTTDRGSAPVRSAWIVRAGESFPRLVTCFVIRPGKGRK